MKFKFLSLATASLVAVALPAAAQPAKPVYGDWGYNPAAMDQSVRPGDDFWAYVNGNMGQEYSDRADRASAGPFVTLSDQAEKDVRQIVEQLANDPQPGPLGPADRRLLRKLSWTPRNRCRRDCSTQALSRTNQCGENAAISSRRCS